MVGEAVKRLVNLTAAGHIDMDIDIIGVDKLPYLLVSCYERGKPQTPRTPVAPKLADKILALTASLLYTLVYLHDRVERLVIYLLH